MEEYNIQQPATENVQAEKKCQHKKCFIARIILDAVMVIAIVVLFILGINHYTINKKYARYV